MTLKTKEYDIFKFRRDNRSSINDVNVQKIIKSIEINNLLFIRPIIVNAQMEVIDGQHRLLAARALNVDIYYNVEESLEANDIILLNNAKRWNWEDYLNFYVVKGLSDYINLKQFCKKYELTLTVGLKCFGVNCTKARTAFKNGTYIFKGDIDSNAVEIANETIQYILSKDRTIGAKHCKSAKFMAAMLDFVRNPGFDETMWRKNYQRMFELFEPRVSKKSYTKLFLQIYNYSNHNKLLIYTD